MAELEDAILGGFPPSSEALYWIARHRLRAEFSLTAEEANYELEAYATEAMVDLKILELIAKKQESDAKRKR